MGHNLHSPPLPCSYVESPPVLPTFLAAGYGANLRDPDTVALPRPPVELIQSHLEG